MMHENSSNPIPSLRDIDALKVKSTVSEVNDNTCYIRVKNLYNLKNLFIAWARLVCKKVSVISNKKEFKEPYWKKRIEDDTARLRKIWYKLNIDLKVDGRTLNIGKNMN